MQRGMMRKEYVILSIVSVTILSALTGGAYAAIPDADFSVEPVNGYGNATVTVFSFTDESSNVPTSWLWEYSEEDDSLTFIPFPIGSTLQNPTLTLDKSGNYNIRLRATNADGTDSALKINLLHISPYITISSSCPSPDESFSLCSGESANINFYGYYHADDLHYHIDWTWDFDNGTGPLTYTDNSYSTSVPVEYTTAGLKHVTLSVTDGSGNTNETSRDWVAFEGPTPDFTVTPHYDGAPRLAYGNYTITDFICSDASTVSNPGNYLWKWNVYNRTEGIIFSVTNPDNRSVTIPHETFEYDSWDREMGLFLINITDGSQCGRFGSIYLTPYANFTSNLTSNKVVVDQVVRFTDTSEIGDEDLGGWVWNCPDWDIKSKGPQNRTLNASFTTTGQHGVSLTLTNTTTTLSNTTMQYFDVAPLPTFTFTNTTLLEGLMPLTVGFTATNTGTPIVNTWNWQFSDDGSHATGQNVLHTFASAGTYTVYLTGTNNTYAGATQTNSTPYTLTGKTGLSVDFTRNPVMGIYPLTVNFTPTVTGDGAKVCNWTFNDGTPVTTTYGVMNVIHTFNGPLATARYYNVTLNVTTPYATAQKTMTNCVQVGVPVSANFTFTPSSGVAPILVSFADTSLGSAIDEWYWKFEGAVPPDESTLKESDVTYQHGGVYRVNLTATSTYFANSNTTSRLITIPEHLAPVANFTATPSREIAPCVISFDASGSTGTPPMTYTWNFDDQSGTAPQNSPYVTHTYNTPREYLPTLIVTNAYGSNSTARPVSIGQRIVPDFSYTIDPQPNGEWPVQFIDESSGSYDHWFWKFGDGGTSTEPDPLHTYYNTASYNVNLTVSSDYYGRSASVNKTVVIDKKPVARFSASPKQGETPLTISFVDESGGLEISGWLWNFGNGDTSNLQNVDYTYTTTGPYEVTLTVTNPYGTDTSPITTIYPYEKLVAAFTADPNLGVKPLDVTFTDNSLGAPDRWVWEFGDLSGFEGQNPPVHTYYLEGQYVVNLTVYKDRYLTDEVGLESVREESIGAEAAIMDKTSRTVTVTETAPPEVSFIALTPITGTVPLTVSFQDTTGEGFKPVEWLWEFGDGAMSTVQNPTHTYEKPGMYTVALNVKNAAGISRAANPVFIAVTETGRFGAADAESIESAPSTEDPGVNETVNETVKQ